MTVTRKNNEQQIIFLFYDLFICQFSILRRILTEMNYNFQISFALEPVNV